MIPILTPADLRKAADAPEEFVQSENDDNADFISGFYVERLRDAMRSAAIEWDKCEQARKRGFEWLWRDGTHRRNCPAYMEGESICTCGYEKALSDLRIKE